MQHFNPAQKVSEFNFAIEVEFYQNGVNRTFCERFGTAKEFAAWLDSFDYESGDVYGWTGDSATSNAADSYRRNSVYGIPEFITEFNTNDGTSEIIGADQFHKLVRMFRRDKDYRIHRHYSDGAKVHSLMYVGDGDAQLSSYVWHVPYGTDELYGS